MGANQDLDVIRWDMWKTVGKHCTRYCRCAS